MAVERVWYPGDLSPHLFYLDGVLAGMAAALPRIWGETQKWEAFDMRIPIGSKTGPTLLGSYEDVALAKSRIEQAFDEDEQTPC
jgi:hypothetical protein